jgi:hypothetical protein
MVGCVAVVAPAFLAPAVWCYGTIAQVLDEAVVPEAANGQVACRADHWRVCVVAVQVEAGNTDWHAESVTRLCTPLSLFSGTICERRTTR